MGPIRTTLASTLALVTLLAWLAPSEAEPTERISARELLGFAQRSGGRAYTFSQATAARLESTEVERPASSAKLEDLEASLREAGFALEPVGPPERQLVRVALGGR